MTASPDNPVAFVDSSAIVALVDQGDATHLPAVNAYRSLMSHGYRLFTTNHVIGETFDLLASTHGEELAREWLENVGLAVYVTDLVDEDRARERVLASNEAHPIRYTDAVSLSVMERLGVSDAFAVDPDFLDNFSDISAR
jgi:predicted nucleic acid-binding protein